VIEECIQHHIADLENDLNLLTQAIHNAAEKHEWEPVYRILSGMMWSVDRLKDYEEVLK